MLNDTDRKFYERADAHIQLANSSLSDVERGRVNASLMFAASRFNAWVTAGGFQSGEDMASKREDILDYFVNQYRSMLEENLNNYIEHFDEYITSAKS